MVAFLPHLNYDIFISPHKGLLSHRAEEAPFHASIKVVMHLKATTDYSY